MILPKKKDIDREKSLELKKEIDSGVALATRIDKLRETKTNEERQLELWRVATIKKIQREIDDYITVADNLKHLTEEAELHRKKLIEPLDAEWIEVNKEKDNLHFGRESLKLKMEEVRKERETITEISNRLKIKESELIIREDNLK